MQKEKEFEERNLRDRKKIEEEEEDYRWKKRQEERNRNARGENLSRNELRPENEPSNIRGSVRPS